MSETYRVVFTGELIAGFERGQVKQNVGQLFKLNEAQLEKLFCGKSVTIKRGLTSEQASKYSSLLAKAGAESGIKSEEIKPVGAAPVPQAKAEPEPEPPVEAVPLNVSAKAVNSGLTCPRCGHEQAFSHACGLCKMDLSLHIHRLERKQRLKEAREQAVP